MRSLQRELCSSDLNRMILDVLATAGTRSRQTSSPSPPFPSSPDEVCLLSAARIAATASDILLAPSHTTIALGCPTAALLENRTAPAPRPDNGVGGNTFLPLESKRTSEFVGSSTRIAQGTHRSRPNETFRTDTLAALTPTDPACVTSTDDPTSLKISDPLALAASSRPRPSSPETVPATVPFPSSSLSPTSLICAATASS
mmetsp:Transcript_11366/g.47557  ORF Transcript_11366/g.47557 Transcript_11366/m.47557 type:complete len:201 (-) Transcript_11366:421-1023(-)